MNEEIIKIGEDFTPTGTVEAMESFNDSPPRRPTASMKLLPEKDSITGAKVPQGLFPDPFVDLDHPVGEDQ